MLSAILLGLLLQLTPEDERRMAEMRACGTDRDCLLEIIERRRHLAAAIDLDDCLTREPCLIDLLHDDDVVIPVSDWPGFAMRVHDSFPHLKSTLLDLAFHDSHQRLYKSGMLLQHWPDLSEDDLPVLLDAFEHQPLQPISMALARYPDERVHRALISAFVEHGPTGSLSTAIQAMGPAILPRLHTVIHDLADNPPDREINRPGRLQTHWRVYSGFKGEARVAIADYWLDVATDRGWTARHRIYALTILQDFVPELRLRENRIASLVAANSEAELRFSALNYAAYFQIPGGLDDLVDACLDRKHNLLADRTPAFADTIYVWCLAILSRYRLMAQDEMHHFAEMVDHRSGFVRAGTLRLAGFLGASEVEQHVLDGLQDKDWRVVHASAIVAAELGLADAIDRLADLERDHWFTEVRQTAGQSRRDLLSPPYSRPPPDVGSLNGLPDEFIARADRAAYDTPCSAGPWIWDNRQIEADILQTETRSGIILENGFGVLEANPGFGEDQGLRWIPDGGTPRTLANGMISTRVLGERSVLVNRYEAFLFDQSSELIAFHLSPDGRWQGQLIDVAPGIVTHMGEVGPGLFALSTPNGLAIMDRTGILGMAECAYAPD